MRCTVFSIEKLPVDQVLLQSYYFNKLPYLLLTALQYGSIVKQRLEYCSKSMGKHMSISKVTQHGGVFPVV
jgi:hypothetical protein